MKLTAIYNAWDGIELLAGSLKCIKPHVDLIIIVWQKRSNFGEEYDPLPEIKEAVALNNLTNVIYVEYLPSVLGGVHNEINKRNLGLEFARAEDCTHFLHMDCDEYYEYFGEAKQAYILSGAAGSVCPLYTYFKRPTWRCDRPDGYYVPFIHQLKPNSTAGLRDYPYYVDPTRRINEHNVTLLPHFMHHFSWVRADIGRKIRNSTAKNNIANGTLMDDYNLLYACTNAQGFYVKDWDRSLITVENVFGIEINI